MAIAMRFLLLLFLFASPLAQSSSGRLPISGPSGVQSTMPVSGLAKWTATPLAANASWSSGWIDVANYQSVMQSYSADVAGALVFDYSADGVVALPGQSSNLVYPPAGVSLNGAVVNHFPATKARFFRLVYTNGNAPQSSFNVMVRLSLDAVVSGQTLSAALFPSAIAEITKAVIEAPASDGTYGKVERTGTSLNVHVTNSSGGGGGGDVTVTNFPATQPISGTVTVANPTTSVSVSNFPAEATKTAVQKTGTLVTTATTADQVILTYTVTVGKTFYLQYLSLQGGVTALSATASILGVISLERPSGTKVFTHRITNPTISLPIPLISAQGEIPIPAGTVIRVVVTPSAITSMTWYANFGGYEQ
jgi:hypothetical protein